MPTEQELLNEELDGILAELGLDAGGEEDDGAFAALSAELAGTEFDMGSADTMTMLGAGDDPELQLMVFGIIGRQARRLVQRLVDLARRYRNCPRCIALVTQTVAHFKAKRYAQAIASGRRAVQCFRTCAS